MGGFSSFSDIASGVGQVAGGASGLYNAYADYRDTKKSFRQIKQNYDATENDLARNAELQAQQMQLEKEEAARNRKNTLKRALATQQAQFSGQGIDTSDGSGEAALLGLYQESSDEKAYRDRMDQLKRDMLAQDTAIKRRRNLLTLNNAYDRARDGLVGTMTDYLT